MNFIIFFSILFTIIIKLTSATIQLNVYKEVFKSSGDINLALILRDCQNNTLQSPHVIQTLIKSAIWTNERLNFLHFGNTLKLGLTIHQVCSENDQFRAIFEVYNNKDNAYQVGLISDFRFGAKFKEFSDILELHHKKTVKYQNFLVDAVVEIIIALNLNNITVVAPIDKLLDDFAKVSRNKWICVQNFQLYQHSPILKNFTGVVVIFGYYHVLNSIKDWENGTEFTPIVIPLDNSYINDLPPNSYLLAPPYYPMTINYPQPVQFLPTPILFEVAAPLIIYAKNIQHILALNCNDTQYKLNCLRNELVEVFDTCSEPLELLDYLKIESLLPDFIYNVYKSDFNQTSYNKILTYHVLEKNITFLDPLLESGNFSEIDCDKIGCYKHCWNFKRASNIIYDGNQIRLRNESWVFAFLSISFLGILFCIAILIFLLVCICRRDILEGNPILSLLLLFTIILMYLSVIPLALEESRYTSLCLARSLAITLSFAASFSLLLSRCILLATASKEVGFMSHIAGPVQSFLCLFMFGVQAALNLQIVFRCEDVFNGYSFVYLLSYNMTLLLLLLCISPLIYKCQRNYREGKYFTIAIIFIVFLWMIWLPCFAFLDDFYKDPILCFGLVSTASVLLGTIFVPRTYLMTIAAARDKLTSTLPSLATATSAIDIYRAGGQPVYDCVNVAAINAVAVARSGVAHIQEPDLYTCPTLPQDDDYDLRCETPINTDKVTRF